MLGWVPRRVEESEAGGFEGGGGQELLLAGRQLGGRELGALCCMRVHSSACPRAPRQETHTTARALGAEAERSDSSSSSSKCPARSPGAVACSSPTPISCPGRHCAPIHRRLPYAPPSLAAVVVCEWPLALPPTSCSSRRRPQCRPRTPTPRTRDSASPKHLCLCRERAAAGRAQKETFTDLEKTKSVGTHCVLAGRRNSKGGGRGGGSSCTKERGMGDGGWKASAEQRPLWECGGSV